MERQVSTLFSTLITHAGQGMLTVLCHSPRTAFRTKVEHGTLSGTRDLGQWEGGGLLFLRGSGLTPQHHMFYIKIPILSIAIISIFHFEK